MSELKKAIASGNKDQVTDAARALVRSNPEGAYEELAPLLTDRKFAAAVLYALFYPKPKKIDPRFFRAAMRWVPGERDEPSFEALFKANLHRPEVKAILVEVVDKLAVEKKEPTTGYFYMMLRAHPVPGTAPGLLTIAQRAAKKGDWRFTAPLAAIIELDDPSALPGLRELGAALAGKTRTGVQVAIAALEAKHPEAKQPSAKSGASKGAPASGKGRSAARKAPGSLAAGLVAAGLSAERAASIVAAARPRIDFAVKATRKPVLGETRFGGEPDLPAKHAWPQAGAGVPLAFIAQLSLAELSPHDVAGLLPKTGMLYFFARGDRSTPARSSRPPRARAPRALSPAAHHHR